MSIYAWLDQIWDYLFNDFTALLAAVFIGFLFIWVLVFGGNALFSFGAKKGWF